MNKEVIFYGITAAAAAAAAVTVFVPFPMKAMAAFVWLLHCLSFTPASLAYKLKKHILQGPQSPARCQNQLSPIRPRTTGQLIFLSQP